jgi:hypothetical protein
VRNEQVRRLEVAVHQPQRQPVDSQRVRVLQAVARLDRGVQGHPGRQRPRLPDQLVEAPSRDELHRDPGLFPLDAEVVDVDDVRMAQPPADSRLGDEKLPRLRVLLAELRAHELERDGLAKSVGPAQLGAEDAPHAALAEL